MPNRPSKTIKSAKSPESENRTETKYVLSYAGNDTCRQCRRLHHPEEQSKTMLFLKSAIDAGLPSAYLFPSSKTKSNLPAAARQEAPTLS